jgi:hypothetical protein
MPHVWAVHITSNRPGDVCPEGPMEFAGSSRMKAEGVAKERSKDPGVKAASVTEFNLDEQGTRRRVSSFVHGERQIYPHTTNSREYVIG